MRPSLGIVSMLIALATLLPAQTRTSLGDLSFVAPAGWSVASDNGATMLTPRDLQPGRSCFVIINPPEMLAGDFPSWFNNKWQSVLRSGSKVVQSSQPQRQAGAGPDSDGVFASAVLQDSQQRTFWVILFGIRVAQRAFPLLWMVNSEQLIGKYQPTVQQLMGSLKLLPLTANNGTVSGGVAGRNATPTGGGPGQNTAGGPRGRSSAPPDTPPPKDRLSGLYVGLKIKGGYNYGVSKDYMVFFPNGRVAWFLPAEGLLDFDVARSQRDDADWWGSYEMRGDAFHIRWATGLEYDGRRNPDGNLVISGTTYVLRTGGVDGRTLSGTYRPENSGSDPSTDVTFYPDGRFDDRGVRGVVGQIDLSNERDAKVPTHAGSGRYRIARNSIVFEYTDGRREQLSFYIPDDDGSSTPPLIVINTYSVVRVPS